MQGRGGEQKCLKYKHADRNPLRFTVNGQNQVKLYPEDDEPTNILNVKRGVVSTLMVPVMEEDKNDNMVIILLSDNISAIDAGSRRDKQVSQCADKMTVLSAAGQSPR